MAGESMDDERAIEGLTRLGLTTYEARAFLALQKLGSATASEVSEVADVPRSQVYGAADSLQDRGLVETQQSTPTTYRPVPLERARTRLLDQLAETGAETFDYLDSVQGESAGEEESEAIWLVRGRDAIVPRIVELGRLADARLLYAVAEESMLEDRVLEALVEQAAAGVAVVVASSNPAVLESVPDSLETYAIPEERDPDIGSARVLVVDRATLLLSVFSARGGGDGREEVAFWSADSVFAAVLAGFLEEFLAQPFD
jgi:sugar-specific transcriptional regulator TrmB